MVIRGLAFRLAFSLLPAGLAGCTHVITTAERTASFAPFAHAKIDNVDAQTFLFRRFAAVFSGVDLAADLKSDPATADTLQFTVPANNGHWGLGAAAAIDRRGYFLTAAHCIEHSPLYLMHGSATNGMLLERIRVVWRGDPRKGEADLALIRVPSSLPQAFEWADTVTKGAIALAAGPDYNPKQPDDFDWGTIAGRIVAVAPGATHPKSQYIWHKLPVHSGDSGGPLTDVQGRLVAINTGAGSWELWPLKLFIARAERPDIASIRKLIEADFAAHPEESPGQSLPAAAGRPGA
jgi:S1-C subfamily serine protease